MIHKIIPDLTVVIASIGRESILNVINQIKDDENNTKFNVEVCIFFDCHDISSTIRNELKNSNYPEQTPGLVQLLHSIKHLRWQQELIFVFFRMMIVG